ncbi:unnamed protein product [Toxocara canis]|uniref:Uncharacterized protein n=1 Tax=Toxocara canis TaxID=6265 RepID=A0A3P7EZL3_TOXCA|nr:unnamed protein product [Toxocara canis]
MQTVLSPGREPRVRFAKRNICCKRDRNDPDYKTLRALASEFSDMSSENSVIVGKDPTSLADGSRSNSIPQKGERGVAAISEEAQEFTATSHGISALSGTDAGDGQPLEALKSTDERLWKRHIELEDVASISDVTQR